MGTPMEAQLGRLGARWSLNFRPRAREVWAGPLGRFHDRPFALRVALADDRAAVGLPFDPTVDAPHTLRQESRPASLRYTAPRTRFGLDLTVDVVAPFYPQNEAVSCAPVFLLDVRLERRGSVTVTAPPPGAVLEIAFRPLSDGRRVCDDRAMLFHADYGYAADRPSRPADPPVDPTIPATVALWALGDHTPDDAGVFRIPLDTVGDALTASFMLIGHCTEPVLTVRGAPHQFRYLDRFPTVSAVADYVRDREADVRTRTALFEHCILASSLDPAAAALVAHGWQGYLTNTWWTVPAANGGTAAAAGWFSVWEGNCQWHNTIDVEYHDAVALLLLWPGLLRTQLTQWAAAVGEDGIVPHDQGGSLTISDRQGYPHAMPVEECCNFLILAFAYWRFTDDWGLVEEHLDVIRRVTDTLLAFDTDGDGFHESGTANTIDDAGPAVQFAPKQTYLAIKALAALDGVATIAEEAADEEWAERCRDRVAAGQDTLDAQAWDGDGYRVSLLAPDDTADDPWTGAPYPGPLFDVHARSPWTTLGLLFHALVDALPDLDPARVRDDLASALSACAGPWGSRHSSAEPVNGWISQNLARDIVAAYFGIDLLGQAGRYWAFQQAQNTAGPGGAFVDTVGANFLAYYPRGAVAMGLLAAAAGLRLDRAAERLTLSPPRVPARVPLLPLADWSRARVPWVTFRVVAGRLVAEFTHEDLVHAVGDVNVEFEPALDPAGPDGPPVDA